MWFDVFALPLSTLRGCFLFTSYTLSNKNSFQNCFHLKFIHTYNCNLNLILFLAVKKSLTKGKSFVNSLCYKSPKKNKGDGDKVPAVLPVIVEEKVKKIMKICVIIFICIRCV